MADKLTGRVDFHLHSHASNVTDYYAANSLAIPESYSDPIVLHRILEERGMSLVTLTDHNSIDGVREMLDKGLSDVFISAEMTTTFPEDGCNIHITVANMTEAQFSEINRLRGNVHEMVAYVDQQIATEASHAAGNKLAYFMTHPLMSTQNRPYGREGSLTVAHIEKALLLCNCIEVQNGARTRAINDLTAEIVRGLDREAIERFANVHDIAPKGPTPWLKSIVGGSDDHAGINPGCTWTEFDVCGPQPSANGLIESMRARTTRPAGAHGGPITIAHSLLKLVYEGGKQATARKGGGAAGVGGSMGTLLTLVFDAQNRTMVDRAAFQIRLWTHRVRAALPRKALSRPFEAVLETEVCAMLVDAEFHAQLRLAASTDDRIFLVVKTVVHRIFAHYVRSLRQSGQLSLVTAIKESVALLSSNLFVSLPYFLAFMQQSSDCQIARDVRRAFAVRQPQKTVLLTDTFFEVNGVSLSIRRMIREAIRREIDFTVVACVAPERLGAHMQDAEVGRFVESGRLKLFPALASLDFPEYDGLEICFPPTLDLLKYLQESGFTKMQISTPGIVGLAGLAAAKLLQIETAATYHTSIPEYVENYTRDVSLEAMAWRYMILFYHSVDEMLVPSRFVADLLHKRGLRNRKLLILDRWVDVERFRPERRSATYWQRHGVADDAVKFVYVGRIAVEKSLHLLAQAYRNLRQANPRAHLIIIGDGPYRPKFEELLHGVPVTFTGYLAGDELATALASCDVKVFPSCTDTWGNAPLEAQASGLPVIVTDIGGPAELMQDGITGYMVRGHDVRALQAAMEKLTVASLRDRMGSAARAFAVSNRVDEPFTAVLDSDAYRRRLRKQKRLQTAAGSSAGVRRPPAPSRRSPRADEAANDLLLPVPDLVAGD